MIRVNMVMVDVGEEKSQLVQTAVFGEAAEKLDGAAKGTRVYIEGTLKTSQWNTADGETRHGLSCAAFTCQRVGSSAIGRNRPKAKHFEQHEVRAQRQPAIGELLRRSRRATASLCRT